ncbi:MAG: AAA family ATPase [Thermoplasmataceae archaeon]
MIIHTLELKNFLSHQDSKINFDLGVNLITGKNGAGKSSIIDGIKFALFGDTKRGSVQDLVTRNRLETHVALGFSVGPDEYRIVRTMSVGRSGIKGRDAILTKNGAELARTVTGVNSAVEDLLGIGEELFLNSVFVEQGEIASLVSENRSVRERTFSHILGLNLLQQFAQDIQEKGKDLKSKLESMHDAEQELAEVRQRINDITGEIQEHEKQVRAAESRQMDLDRKLRDADSDLQASRNRVMELKAASERRDELETKKLTLDRELAQKTITAEKLKRDIFENDKSVDQRLIDSQESIEQYLDIQSRLGNNLTMLHDAINRLEKISADESELKKLAPIHSEYEGIQKNYMDVEERIKALESANSEYDYAIRYLDQTRKKIEDTEAELKSLQGKLSGIISGDIDEAGLADLKKSLDAEKTSVNIRMGEIKAEVGQINEQRRRIAGSIEEINRSSVCPLCKQDITQEHRSKIVADYNREDSELIGRIQILSSEKKDLEARKGGIESSISALSSGDVQRLFSLRRDIETLKIEVRNNEATLRRHMHDHEEYTELKTKYLQEKQKLQELGEKEKRYNSLMYAIQSSGRADLEARKIRLETENSGMSRDLNELSSSLGFKPDADTGKKLKASLAAQRESMNIREQLTGLEADMRAEYAQKVSMEAEIAKLLDILKSRSDTEKSLHMAQDAYDRARKELDEQLKEVSAARGKIEALENSLKMLREDERGAAERVTRLEKIRSAISAIDKIRYCFDRDGIQKTIRKDSAVFITNMMREYSLAFNLNFDDVRVEEDMGIQVSQNGNMESVDMLSGGERTALAIALRLAIVKYVNDSIKTMVLDEPTVFLDEDRRQNLTDILQYTFNGEENPIPQMIIVSHHSELRSVSNNVFEVTKQNGTSSVQPAE